MVRLGGGMVRNALPQDGQNASGPRSGVPQRSQYIRDPPFVLQYAATREMFRWLPSFVHQGDELGVVKHYTTQNEDY
jgi:hypothetical protein